MKPVRRTPTGSHTWNTTGEGNKSSMDTTRMSQALNPNNQPQVTELEILILRRLHLMDDLNAELGELFREHHALTGDPATAEAMETARKIDAAFRSPQ
jgi:hypothetical protein